MNNSKIKKSIVLILVVLILISLYIIQSRNKDDEKIMDEEIIFDKKLELGKSNIVNSLEELKNNYPDFDASRLDFYYQSAEKGIGFTTACERIGDSYNCITAVAYLRDDIDICGKNLDSDLIFKCANSILEKEGIEKVDKCWELDFTDRVNCLNNIFVLYKNPEDCSGLRVERIKNMCEDIVYYNQAFIDNEVIFCEDISNDELKNDCLKQLIDKTQDSDNDGLLDFSEIFIYGTDPQVLDTDGDGYSDGEEVSAGYNPLGEGRL